MSKGKKKVDVTIGVSTITIIIAVVGILLIIISNIPFGKFDTMSIVQTLKNISEAIGTTLFSAGLVSVVVELSSISNIVSKTPPFETLATSRLNEINKQVALYRLEEENLTEKDVVDSPYILEPELLGLTKGLYYEYHKAKFIVTPDEKEGVFKKRVEFDYKIINKCGLENKAEFTIRLVCQRDDLTKEELQKRFSVKLFKVGASDRIGATRRQENEEDLTSDANSYWNILEIEPHEHSLYKYEIHFEYKLSDKRANKVKVIYEYEILQSDIVQSYKLNYPSKILEHEISINSNAWEITGDAYTAFYFPDVYDRDYTVVQSVPTSIRIDFREWSMPGAGYMVTFLKK